ncbi:MAG: histidinol-phosphate transaminase [Elusimicrobia bacterium]|nr:histidinol-phosphate transaminase [Elusimicrobiota bacterium]
MRGIRKAFQSLDVYVPGKPIADLLRDYPSLRPEQVVKLASNESPLGSSPLAIKAARRALAQAHLYPEPTSYDLRRRLGKLHDVPMDGVIVTSGADEALRLAAETVIDAGDFCVISQYAFSRFRQHARLMGAQVIETPARNYGHDFEAMARAAIGKAAKIIFIANPNNPTGTMNTDDELRMFFKDLLAGRPPGKEPWVVLDEAYDDFARDAYGRIYPMSLPQFLKLYPRLIVARTFSKIGGLAGLRVGYAVADPQFILLVHRARLIFNVSSVAQAAALASLDDVRYRRKILNMVKEGRRYLMKNFSKYGLDVVGPSAGNFVFAKVRSGTGLRLYETLLPQGIIIRPIDEPGLERFVRITIGSRSQNRVLLKALRSLGERSVALSEAAV